MIIITSLVIFLLAACNSSSDKTTEIKNAHYALMNSYSKKTDSVYYTTKKIEEADPETFQAINEFYGKDKNNVFYQTRKIEADPKTAKAVGPTYLKDKQSLYNSYGKTIHDVDIATFELISEYHAKDQNAIYILSSIGKKIKGADPASFESLNWSYGKDAQKVFWNTEEIKGADASTFEALETFGNAKDKNYTYEMGNPKK